MLREQTEFNAIEILEKVTEYIPALSKYTKTRRPVRLVYFETFATKEEAMSREYHIKRMSRQEKIKLISK